MVGGNPVDHDDETASNTTDVLVSSNTFTSIK